MRVNSKAGTGSGLQAGQAGQAGQGGQKNGYAYSTQNFYAFPPGTTFKALILNIQPGKVTIRLDKGGNFTARTLVSPDARIGEESLFRVKVNNLDGLIQLEMIKGSLQERQENAVQEALKSANMVPEEGNVELGRALIDNKLPVDEQTLQKAAFFRYSQSEEKPEVSESGKGKQISKLDKTLFLLQEGFPAESASISALEASLDPSKHLSVSLEALHTMVENLPMSGMQQALAEIMGPPERLFLALENNRKPIGSFYEELRVIVQQMQERLSSAGQSFRNIQTSLASIKENLSFIQQVSQNVQYYQIPFISRGQTSQGELFVYRDRKSGDNLDKKANVVIALDTANLGRIEVLTNKEEKRLSLKFSGETNDILAKIQEQSPQLSKALQEKGFQITALSYQKREERTSVLSPSPIQAEAPATSTDARRYTFDMRV